MLRCTTEGKLAEREGLAPPIPQCGTTVFGTASSSGRTRSVKVAPEAGLAPATLRLTGGRTTIVLLRIQTGLPGRTRTCDLRVRSSAFCNLNYGELKMVGHLGSAPSVSRFQAGWIAIFLVPANWRPGRVLPPLSPARQAGESAVPLPSLETGG